MGSLGKQKFLFISNNDTDQPVDDSVRRSHIMHHRSSPTVRQQAEHRLHTVQHSPSSGRFTYQLSNKRKPQQMSPARSHGMERMAFSTYAAMDPDTLEDSPKPIKGHTKRQTSRQADGQAFQHDSRSDGFSGDTGPHAEARPDPDSEVMLKVEDIPLSRREQLFRLSTSPLLFFGTARLDPLGVLPFPLTSWDEELLDRFSHQKKWPWCPVSGQSLWAPFAMSDKMVFSATMYSWSMAFRNRLTGDEAISWLENNPQVLEHKVTAISLINESLNETSTALNDETLAAVAVIANLELVFGTYATASHHMDGLRRLIDLRGGIHIATASPIQQLIYRLVSWTGLVYSNIHYSPLYFPALELWDISWRTLDSLSLPGSPLCFSPFEMQETGIGHYELIDVLQSMRRLCHAEQRRPLKDVDETERMLRADMCSDLEMRLTRIIGYHNGDTNGVKSARVEDRTWNYALWRSTALSAQIYIHHFLRGVPLYLPQFQVWCRSLGESFEISCGTNDNGLGGARPTSAHQQFSFSRSLLLWTLSLGVMASSSRVRGVEPVRASNTTNAAVADHDFFLKELRHATKRLKLHWEDYVAALKGFFWTGAGDEVRFLSVWRDVTMEDSV